MRYILKKSKWVTNLEDAMPRYCREERAKTFHVKNGLADRMSLATSIEIRHLLEGIGVKEEVAFIVQVLHQDRTFVWDCKGMPSIFETLCKIRRE